MQSQDTRLCAWFAEGLPKAFRKPFCAATVFAYADAASDVEIRLKNTKKRLKNGNHRHSENLRIFIYFYICACHVGKRDV